MTNMAHDKKVTVKGSDIKLKIDGVDVSDVISVHITEPEKYQSVVDQVVEWSKGVEVQKWFPFPIRLHCKRSEFIWNAEFEADLKIRVIMRVPDRDTGETRDIEVGETISAHQCHSLGLKRVQDIVIRLMGMSVMHEFLEQLTFEGQRIADPHGPEKPRWCEV
jgi:hypothetical protein